MKYACSLLAIPVLFLVAAHTAAHASGKPGERCDNKPKHSLLGSIAGQIAGNAFDRTGIPSGVGGLYIPVSSLISSGITRLLDCREQKQAATATQTAVRGGVGTTSAWTSDSRPNVSGSSTVNSQNRRADGSTCLAVTDVVIVNGEETRETKNMCRTPGSSNYTLAA